MTTTLIRTLALVLATSTASVAFASGAGEAGAKPEAPTKHAEIAVTCAVPHESDFRANLAAEGMSSSEIDRVISAEYDKLCGGASDVSDEVRKDRSPTGEFERPGAPATERPKQDNGLQAPGRPSSGKRGA